MDSIVHNVAELDTTEQLSLSEDYNFLSVFEIMKFFSLFLFTIKTQTYTHEAAD